MYHKAILTPIEKYDGFIEWGPDDFNANAERFQTADFDRNNMKILNGVLPDGERELHEVRFNADAFTEKAALAWLEVRKLYPITFSPADRSQEDWFSDYELAENSALEAEFEIAVTGKYPQGDLTPDLFDKIIKNFKPNHHEPPITLGHVTKQHNDKPAFGWVSKIRRAGDKLLASGKQIAKDLDTFVREGRFKKRSIGLRVGPKGPYLHHLAFLGAAGPACKGLKDIYDDNSDIESQRNYEIETEINLNKGVPMKTFTEEENRNAVAKAKREGSEAGKAEAKAEFDEDLKNREKAAEEKGKAAAKKEFDDTEEKREATRNFRSDVDSRIKKLFDDKKIIPAQVEPLRALGYSMQETTEITFSETDPKDKTKKVERKSAALDLLFSVAETAKAPEGKLDDPDNPDAKGGENYAEQKKKAKALMKEDATLTFGDALKKVREDEKEADDGDGE
jgi:hypothetical protein